MMLAFGLMGSLLCIALITVSLLLIGLILLQKNRGAGLSGAFGGVGGHSAFGTKTGDFLTWVTVGLVTIFLLLNITGVFVLEPDAPAAAAPPAAPTPVSSGAESPIGVTGQAAKDARATTPTPTDDAPAPADPAPQPPNPSAPPGP